MSEIIVTTREEEELAIELVPGMSLMQAITDAGVDEVLALCGGVCSCGTCHVYISADYQKNIPAISGDEDLILSGSSHRTEASRLSCQILLIEEMAGMQVKVAPEE